MAGAWNKGGNFKGQLCILVVTHYVLCLYLCKVCYRDHSDPSWCFFSSFICITSIFSFPSFLSIITKKHVRRQYQNHVGRELTIDEKTGINELVYAFVRDLAVEQKVKQASIFFSQLLVLQGKWLKNPLALQQNLLALHFCMILSSPEWQIKEKCGVVCILYLVVTIMLFWC